MKKKSMNKKLQLNKETVARMSQKEMMNANGGAAEWWSFQTRCTAGCTDGCWIFQSKWNCTEANCTANCND